MAIPSVRNDNATLWMVQSPLERVADLVADGQPIREVILLPAGAHRSNIDPADTRGLRLRWERENRRAKASQARTEAIPGTRNEVAVEIRSPAWYDQLAEVGA